MADVRVELAAHLTYAPSAVPDAALGQQIYSTLRAPLPADGQTITDDVADDAWSTAPTATWDSTPSNNAVRGIATLMTPQDWLNKHGNELTALLTPFLDSPNPTYRYLARRHFPGSTANVTNCSAKYGDDSSPRPTDTSQPTCSIGSPDSGTRTLSRSTARYSSSQADRNGPTAPIKRPTTATDGTIAGCRPSTCSPFSRPHTVPRTPTLSYALG
jgi:hypothetical protein